MLVGNAHLTNARPLLGDVGTGFSRTSADDEAAKGQQCRGDMMLAGVCVELGYSLYPAEFRIPQDLLTLSFPGLS